MTQPNNKVDAYIAKSANFARPILTYLREINLTTCAGVEEDIKWGIKTNAVSASPVTLTELIALRTDAAKRTSAFVKARK